MFFGFNVNKYSDKHSSVGFLWKLISVRKWWSVGDWRMSVGVSVFFLPSLGFLSASRSCCCCCCYVSRRFLLRATAFQSETSSSWRRRQDEVKRTLLSLFVGHTNSASNSVLSQCMLNLKSNRPSCLPEWSVVVTKPWPEANMLICYGNDHLNNVRRDLRRYVWLVHQFSMEMHLKGEVDWVELGLKLTVSYC